MSNEIQKDEYYLPGDLGTVKIGNDISVIKVATSNRKDNSITLTIQPAKISHEVIKITKENAEQFGLDKECAELTIDKLLNIEDAEFEVIEPKALTDKVKGI